MKTNDIPADEIEALRLCHKHHGRNAKSMIRDAWMTGNYRDLSSEIDSGALQRFRNSPHGGPSRLNSLVLARLLP